MSRLPNNMIENELYLSKNMEKRSTNDSLKNRNVSKKLQQQQSTKPEPQINVAVIIILPLIASAEA